jgi:MFS family permease
LTFKANGDIINTITHGEHKVGTDASAEFQRARSAHHIYHKGAFAVVKSNEIKKDAYATSRTMYVVEALFEYFISILVSGAYLAKITTTIGISDGMTAVITAVTSLAGLFQLVSIYLAHKTPVKRWIIPIEMLNTLTFASIYLIPILDIKENVGIIFFIVITLANALKHVASPVKINWFMKLVPSHKRGFFQSSLVIVSVIGGTAFTLAVSALIDYLEAKGEMNTVFLILGMVTLALVVIHTIPLLIAKEKPEIYTHAEPPYRAAISLLKNKNYRRTVISYTLYGIAYGLVGPFLSTYQINELGFSMTFIAVMNFIHNILWIIMLAFFGKLSVKLKSKDTCALGYVFAFLTYFTIIFTTPANGIVLFFIHRVFGNLYAAANTASHHKLLFDLTPPEDRTTAVAISAACVGTFGFITTLITRPFFDFLQTQDLSLFGHKIYAQQALAMIASLIFIFLNIYWNIFKRRINDDAIFDDI